MVRQVMEHIVRFGEVRRGHLGVSVQNLTPALAAAFDLVAKQGAVVVEVAKESPAARAGLKLGDIVVALNDRPVRSAADLRNSVGLLGIGEEVRMDIVRAGQPQTLITRIAEPVSDTLGGGDLHPHFDGATFGLARGSGGGQQGVLVTELERGSAAWGTGLRRGDVIVQINRKPIGDLRDLVRLVNANPRNLTLNIHRGSTSVYILIR